MPAENAAIENKLSPKEWTEKNIENMKKQLKSIGLSINWEKEINNLLIKKFPKTKYNFDEEKTKAKAINFLQRRGFDFDLSYRQVIGY